MSFEEAFKSFTEISATEAQEKLVSEDFFVLFVGRLSCHCCQRFVPKLAAVASQLGQEIAYVNSENMADIASVQNLRTTYNIPTVPGLLVVRSGQVSVVCDSTMSEEAISDFIKA